MHQLLVVASGAPGVQGFVELFDLQSGQSVWTQACPDVPVDLAFSPDGKQLAVGQSDGTLLLAIIPDNAGDSVRTQSLSPHADAILAVNWSEKGDRLITGSRDRTAKIFDTSSWQLIANYDRHERAGGGVSYWKSNPVSLDETGKLRLWSGDDNDRTIAEHDNLARFLEPVLAAHDRIWLAMGTELRSYEVERKKVDDGKDDEGKPKQKTTTRLKAADSLSSNSSGWLLSLDAVGKLIAAGNERGEVILWQVDESKPWRQFTAKP
jgi:WD40 repeat protein